MSGKRFYDVYELVSFVRLSERVNEDEKMAFHVACASGRFPVRESGCSFCRINAKKLWAVDA